ncbi:MAG: dTDP-4-dehydrorhamnose reductase [Aquabacterium sp.]|nr:MAG: dTDP-4-dehydrorhamnose reductase [Aquabacterium sp.]
MTRPAIVLLGAAGQVGRELGRALLPLGEVVPLTRAEVDLSDPSRVLARLEHVRPAIVVNAAAYTAVDRAEQEPALAEAVNGELPALLAGESQRLGFKLVHYSTDYVFDGALHGNPRPLREDDPTGPASVYGRSKLTGESAALIAPRALVFRLSWVFGRHGGNFVQTMLRLARERDSLRVVSDQHGCPTPAALVADLTVLALRAELSGLYHLSSSEATTWHAYAQVILEQARALGMPLRVQPEAVQAIPTSSYPTPAARPAWSVLDCSRLERALGLKLPGWRPYLADMLRDIAPAA